MSPSQSDLFYLSPSFGLFSRIKRPFMVPIEVENEFVTVSFTLYRCFFITVIVEILYYIQLAVTHLSVPQCSTWQLEY